MYYRAKTQEIVLLRPPGDSPIDVIGIDAQDRVVALCDRQKGYGFTTVVRFDPVTGEPEQLLPKPSK